MKHKEDKILQVAEAMVREGGYNNFSFRDIAKAVGIKSSSVHYHFPTKADLGAALARSYADKFMEQLGDPKQLILDGQDPIGKYVEAFRKALLKDRRMCLCGLLGAEIDGLPSEVVKETRAFFERNIEWLIKAYQLKGFKKQARSKAVQTLSILEGAMMISKVLGNAEAFEQSTKLL